MSSWEEIQAVKVKRNSLREKLEKRKKERQDLLGNSSPGGPGAVAGLIKIESATNLSEDKGKLLLTSIKSDQTGSAGKADLCCHTVLHVPHPTHTHAHDT